LGKERASLELVVKTIDDMDNGLSDTKEMLLMAQEEGDGSLLESISEDIDDFEKRLAELEFRRMFSGEMDANNTFLDIQSGSGGTEAQDWADMLLRMYLRWGGTTWIQD